MKNNCLPRIVIIQLGLLPSRSSSREVRIRVPSFPAVYFSRGTLPLLGDLAIPLLGLEALGGSLRRGGAGDPDMRNCPVASRDPLADPERRGKCAPILGEPLDPWSPVC